MLRHRESLAGCVACCRSPGKCDGSCSAVIVSANASNDAWQANWPDSSVLTSCPVTHRHNRALQVGHAQSRLGLHRPAFSIACIAHHPILTELRPTTCYNVTSLFKKQEYDALSPQQTNKQINQLRMQQGMCQYIYICNPKIARLPLSELMVRLVCSCHHGSCHCQPHVSALVMPIGFTPNVNMSS